MDNFIKEICNFLCSRDLYIYKVGSGCGYESLSARFPSGKGARPMLLLGATANTLEMAKTQQEAAQAEISRIYSETGSYPLIITEDRWYSQNEAMRQRILSHLEIFTQIYARNCEIRRIDKATAKAFLEAHHSYGDAACKYRYGLYLKRHTGHNAINPLHPGTLVAVATFSNARKWVKGEKTIRSYEWTRYASLPGVRLSGGMGKALRAFIEEVRPDDIMTYADLEWSEGKVYEQLGFTCEGTRPAVSFIIDPSDWSRIPLSSEATAGVDMPPPARGCLAEGQTGVNGSCASEDMPTPASKIFQNFGSNKYRLKLTDYQ